VEAWQHFVNHDEGPMNYRHGFHAGSFADVVKHAVLARILVHLAEKPRPFRVVDTHAGAGLYDLAGSQASRTGEWRHGIGRVIAADVVPDVRALLEPYLSAVAAHNPTSALSKYPGSPLLSLALMRRQDRLVACELEPQSARALSRTLKADARANAVSIDGWMALNAYLPPRERRGVVIIDPPFEDKHEFTRLADALARAHRKWPTGIYLLWYPIKDRGGPDALARRLKRAGFAKILRAELTVWPTGDPNRLNGTGLAIVNPPWMLEAELTKMLPALAAVLAREGRGGVRLNWLAAALPG
jgi:23S rRNA (adenine2030-N6)-methyltransferase